MTKLCISGHRFFLILSLVFVINQSYVSAQTKSSAVTETLYYQNAPLRTVLKDLESKFSVTFNFVESLVSEVMVTAQFSNQDLPAILRSVLTPNSIHFTEIKPDEYILAKAGNNGKPYDISGRIISSNQQEPVPFVAVYIRELSLGTTADEKGRFAFQQIPEGKYDLQMSSVGYEPLVVKIQVPFNGEITFTMSESYVQLQAVEITPGSFELSTLSSNSFSLSREELLHRPNLARDLIKNLKSIPGIANDDISAKTRIRGGDWDETAIFYDNLEIYEPFHLEEVNGFASIFDIELIRNSKILTGGFSSRYTNKMSGIIEVNTSDYVSENATSLSIDLLGLGLQTQQRFNDKLSAIASFRRGYLDLFVRAEQNGIRPRYYDGNLKINHKLSPTNHLSYHVLFSRDNLDFSTDLAILKPEFYNSKRDNFYSWLNWKWIPSAKFSSQSTIGFQTLRKRSNFLFESSLTDDNRDNRFARIFSINNRNYYQPAANHSLEFGLEFKGFDTNYLFQEARIDQIRSSQDTVFTDFVDINLDFTGYTLAGYMQDLWQISDKVELNLGLRISGESYTGDIHLAPRMATSFNLGPSFNLKLAYGKYFQAENFQKLKSYENRTSLSDENMSSTHYVGTLRYEKKNMEWMLTGYYKDYEKLFNDYRFDFYNRATLVNIVDYQDFNTVSGTSKGVELFLRQTFKKGFMAVTYALARNQIANSLGEMADRDFDRRHAINLNLVFETNRNITLSSTWTYHSGNPYTESEVRVVSRNTPDELIYYNLGPKNGARLPAYHALDLKIEKSWQGRTTKTAYFNIVNLYNRKNIRNFHWAGEINDFGEVITSRQEVGLPTLFISPGFRWQF